MKRLLVIVPFAVILLSGCVASMPPRVEQIPVPVPFCPAPPEYLSQLPKQGGIDTLTPESLPGEVAKQWHYEVEYLRSLVEIQTTILDAYRKNNADLEHLQKDLQRMIDETNKKLQEAQMPTEPL